MTTPTPHRGSTNERLTALQKRRSCSVVTQTRAWFGLVALAAPLAGVPASAHPAPAPPTHPGWVHPPLLAAPAPPRSIDPPLRMTVRDTDGQALRGAMTAFDPLGFLFEVRGEDRARRIPWTVLTPARVFKVHDRLLDRDDGEGWLQLGASLYLRDAPDAGDDALERALRADPRLTDRAQLARAGRPIGEPGSPGDEGPGGDADGDGDGPVPDTPAGPDGGGAVKTNTPTGPVSEGETQAAFWGTLSEAVMRSSTEGLLAEAQTARNALGLDLKVYDASQYYLFVSDMPPGEARKWAGLLDRLYDRLCDTFDVPRGTNVFRGRGLIYVFRRERDYHRFHQVISGYDSLGSAGLCKSYGNGHVEITFYRQSDSTLFSHVLVHEAVHGFLHRYRSFPFVVSWANEGLAEFVAADLVGLYRPRQVRGYVAGVLRQTGGTGGMLGDRAIDGWQYPIAQALCDFMIAQDRGRYRDFINAIKDGKPWREALEDDYGVSRERLLAGFGRALGIQELRH